MATFATARPHLFAHRPPVNWGYMGIDDDDASSSGGPSEGRRRRKSLRSAADATATTTTTTTPTPACSIVHHHNEMLAQWTALLDCKGAATLIHFDSHSDLGCPLVAHGPDLHQSLQRRDLAAVSAQCEIGTWIVPAVYMGLVDCVVWFTALDEQFGPGRIRRVWVGWHRTRQQLVILGDEGATLVTGVEGVFLRQWIAHWGNHWIDGDDTDEARHVEGRRPLEIVVVRVPLEARDTVERRGSTTAAAADLAARVSANRRTRPWLVSVDLDFYSTHNPALTHMIFKEEPAFRRALLRSVRSVRIDDVDDMYRAILRLCGTSDGDNDTDIRDDEDEALDKLVTLTCRRHVVGSGGGGHDTDVHHVEAREAWSSLRTVLTTERRRDRDLVERVAQLMVAVVTSPEHVSSWDEIQVLERRFDAWMAACSEFFHSSPPTVYVGCARSPEYTPVRQVDDLFVRTVASMRRHGVCL